MATKVLGTLGTIPTLTVGGFTFTDVSSKLIVLAGYVDNLGLYCTLRRLNDSAGYQVTAGKTLTIYAMRLYIQAVDTNDGISVGYGSNDVGINSSTPPTGAFYQGNSVIIGVIPPVVGVYEQGGINMQVAQNLYPSVRSLGNVKTSVYAWGYEA